MKKTQNNHDVAGFASELHWLAFCYVAGELTAEQSAQFEQRLAEDLEAQVAVADAVSLCSSTYASIETSQDDKVALGRGQSAETDRSPAWRWVTVAAVGLVAVVSLWQLLPGSLHNDDVAVEQFNSDRQVANPEAAMNALDLWDRTIQMHQSADPHGDGFEIWPPNSADDSRAGDYSQQYLGGDDDSEEIADALLVDSDLATIFASALSSLDPLEGEM